MSICGLFSLRAWSRQPLGRLVWGRGYWSLC